jgi:hypothetical protein
LTIDELVKQKTEKEQKGAKPSESVTLTDAGMDIVLPRTRIHTLEQLMAHFQVDLRVWEVSRWTCNKYEQGAKNDKGKIVVEPLYQVKAFLTRRKDMVGVLEEIESLKKLATKAIRIKWPAVPPPSKSGNMLEIAIVDQHFGKLAWSGDTGHENYDTKIAVEVYWRAFNALLARTAHLKFDRVLFLVGNDCMNTDDLEGRTTAGTYVTTDGRYHKTFEIVRNLKIESVQRLRKIAPVDVVGMPGNHDEKASYHLTDSLAMYFHDCPDVTVDNRPLPRKYVRWGKTLIGFTHGHRGKKNDLPLVMATEVPEWFGAAQAREFHCAHLHKKFVDEFHGVRVRVLSALTGTDSWHSNQGLTSNLRSSEAFVWNKEQGMIATAEYTEWPGTE